MELFVFLRDFYYLVTVCNIKSFSWTVDGFCKCERWERSDNVDSKESKTTSWLHRFIGRAKRPDIKWPFPFVEGKLFVLTLQAGVEGYHIYAGGRHVSSFPYRTVRTYSLNSISCFNI